MKKAMVFMGVLLMVSGLALAGSNGSPDQSPPQEMGVFVNRGGGGGFLGVYLREIIAEDVTGLGLPAERGVFLVKVTEASPAEKAGLEKGDVIVEFQGLPVLSVSQFQRMVGDTPPGRKVEIKLYRNRKQMSLAAEIGESEQPGYRGGRLNLPVPQPGEGTWSFRFPEGRDGNDGSPTDRRRFSLPDQEQGGGNRFYGFPDGTWRGMRPYNRDNGPILGIEGASMTSQMADFMGLEESEGVLVTGVMKDSPAEAAGIKAGDLITAVDGRKVNDPVELRDGLKEGSQKLELVRNKQKTSVEVTIEPRAERKSSRETFRM